MTGVLFSPTANRCLDQIWDYTFETWGQRQAEAYLRGLEQHLAWLAREEMPWRPLRFGGGKVDRAAAKGLFYSLYRRHYVFFRRQEAGPGIVLLTILHERMDMLRRLRKDLPG